MNFDNQKGVVAIKKLQKVVINLLDRVWEGAQPDRILHVYAVLLFELFKKFRVVFDLVQIIADSEKRHD